MNEIDKTVERIGQLPEIITVIKFNEGFADIRSDDLKNLANAYTQLKADLATAKQALERYATQKDRTVRCGACGYENCRQANTDRAKAALSALEGGK